MEGRFLAGLIGQILITISAIVTLIISSIMSLPVPSDYPQLFSIIQTPPFGLPITDFYYCYPCFDWLIFGSYNKENWFRLTSGSSFTGFINSSIFFISVMLVMISFYRIARGSGENSGTTIKVRNLFKATLAITCIAYLLSILSHVLSLGMSTYSYECLAYFEGFPVTCSIIHIYLNSFGWLLLIVQNIFGVVMMVLLGVFIKGIASRMKENTHHAKRLWSAIGETYMMSGGLVVFTIFIAFTFAQANITFFVPIMLIVPGVFGTTGFIISKPTMFPKITGTTGSMKNTTGSIIKEVYDMEASVRRTELEGCKNEADKFINGLTNQVFKL